MSARTSPPILPLPVMAEAVLRAADRQKAIVNGYKVGALLSGADERDQMLALEAAARMIGLLADDRRAARLRAFLVLPEPVQAAIAARPAAEIAAALGVEARA